MAAEHPTWGYTRIQGALQNVGHRVGRSTVRWMMKAAGLSTRAKPSNLIANVSQGPLGVVAGEDFFATEVWTWRGLVTYYTRFVLDLACRRVQILGSTTHPEALFMRQVVRQMTLADDGLLGPAHVLICDRDSQWSGRPRFVAGCRNPGRGDADPRPERQCLRGAVRTLDQGGVPQSADSDTSTTVLSA